MLGAWRGAGHLLEIGNHFANGIVVELDKVDDLESGYRPLSARVPEPPAIPANTQWLSEYVPRQLLRYDALGETVVYNVAVLQVHRNRIPFATDTDDHSLQGGCLHYWSVLWLAILLGARKSQHLHPLARDPTSPSVVNVYGMDPRYVAEGLGFEPRSEFPR